MHPMQLRSPCVSQNGGGDGVQPHGSFSTGQVLAAIYDFYQEQVVAEEQLELLHVDPRLRRSVQVGEEWHAPAPSECSWSSAVCVYHGALSLACHVRACARRTASQACRRSCAATCWATALGGAAWNAAGGTRLWRPLHWP